MKKTFTVLLIFRFLSTLAQATTVTIGTGFTNSSSGGPVYIGNPGSIVAYTRQIAIYQASEINAGGVISGSLQKIRWYKADANGYSSNDGQFKIHIKHTAQSTYTTSSINWTTEISGAKLVYSSSTQNLNPAIGWQEFILSTPFIWNGVDNLEIFVDWYKPSASTGQINWQYTTANSNSAFDGKATPPTSVNVSAYRPNVQLEFGANTVTDAGVAAITAPVSPVLPSVSMPVQVMLRNFGGSALTSATIGWSVDGVLQTPYNWSGNLASAQASSPVSIGTFSFPAGNHSVCAWTKSPNGTTDFNSYNDSTCTTLAACAPMAGNYTINSGAAASSTNFPSFTAAAKRLNECGVSGPVKFTVASGSGPYTEQIELAAFPGATASDSVVFEGNGAVLSATLTAAKPTAVLLKGARQVKFRHLNLNLTPTASTTGYGFQLLNGADYTVIANCNITMPVSTNYLYGIIAGATSPVAANFGNFSSYSVFANNTITGGYRSIRLQGDTATLATQNRIVNNQVWDFWGEGIFLQNTRNTLVEGNDLSRPNSGNSSGFTGINLDRGNRNAIISRNRIHNTHGNSTNLITPAYGIKSGGCDAPLGSENIIKNNLIYDFNNTGDKIAFGNTTSDGMFYYHNTVYFNNPTIATGRIEAIYVTSATNLKFKNNIISINGAGSYKNYVYHFGTEVPALEISNNVVYADPANLNFTGFAGSTDYLTLAQWQASTPFQYDANSQAINPQFANVASGNLRPTATTIMHTGLPLAAVPDDFNGTPRSITNPDPGAYEFSITGLAEARNTAFSVKAFPNPFSEQLNLQLTAEKPGELHLTLMDALGKTIGRTTEKLQTGTQRVEPHFGTYLPAGFYILQVELNGLKTQQKLIKQ